MSKLLHLHRLKQNIRELWQSNLWFEVYMAKMLDRLGWRTWVHVKVMGANSGVSHDVDVLSVRRKEGRICLIECKTGDVTQKDVYNFWTKVYDTGAHLGLLAMIQGLSDPEALLFIEKNPYLRLLENIGECVDEQIMSRLKEI